MDNDIRQQAGALYAEREEYALIGAVGLDQDAVFRVKVQPEAIHDPRLRRIWAAILDLAQGGVAVNTLSIADALPDQPFHEVSALLSQCLNATPGSAQIEWYAERVKASAARRRNLALAEELAKDAHKPEVTPGESAARVATALINDSIDDGDAVTAPEVAEDVIQRVGEWCEAPLQPGQVRGLSTGLSALDYITEGIQPALYIVAAETHVGKTALALHVTENVAGQAGALYMTFEQGTGEMSLRHICSMAGVSSKRAKRGLLSPDEQRRVKSAAGLMSRLDWSWYDGDSSLHAVLSQIHKAKARNPRLALVVVDNLGYVKADAGKEYENLTTVSRALLSVSRRLDIAVLALHQVRRAGSGYKRPRPTLDDIRDAGTIGETASVVWILDKTTSESEADAQAARFGEGQCEVLTIWQDKNKLDGIVDRARVVRINRTNRLHDMWRGDGR